MEQQNRCDVVQPLHVPQLQVIYTVSQQHFSQHLSEDAGVVEGRACDVGAMQVFLDLGDVVVRELYCSEFQVGCYVCVVM